VSDEGGTLGTITNFVTPPPGSAKGANNTRTRRYKLQRVAAELLPGERVSWCLKLPSFGHEVIDLVQYRKADKIWGGYAHVMT